ncbi:MAG TPA: hypothetical protein VJ777_10935 [Mycobacterium sp.]|nr:hypothetical protein [Mycobacterium sp.]
MAFDIGFNFRQTAVFVTDPAYGVPVLGEAFPHTYTNVNGYSVNGGWDTSISIYDNNAANDPRIAGSNYNGSVGNNGVVKQFKVDLSSGSAPGAGTYDVDVAMGETGFADIQDFKILDTSTVLIDGTNGGAGYVTGSGHFIDATLANIVASTTWTGTKATKTFATTLAAVGIGYDNVGGLSIVAHFRLTLQDSGARRSAFLPFFVPGLLSTPS